MSKYHRSARPGLSRMVLSLVGRFLSFSRWPPLALAQRCARVFRPARVPNRTREGLLGRNDKEKFRGVDDDENIIILAIMAVVWIALLYYSFGGLRAFFYPPLPPAQLGDDKWFQQLFPRGMPELVIVTPIIFPNGTPHHIELTQANHAAYAERHGYSLVALTPEMVPSFAHADEMKENPRHPVWYKVTGAMFVLRLLRTQGTPLASGKRTWLWLLDSDVVFTNLSKPIFETLPELDNPKYEMVMSQDQMGLNAGSWFVAADEWSERLLDRVWKSEIPGDPLRGVF